MMSRKSHSSYGDRSSSSFPSSAGFSNDADVIKRRREKALAASRTSPSMLRRSGGTRKPALITQLYEDEEGNDDIYSRPWGATGRYRLETVIHTRPNKRKTPPTPDTTIDNEEDYDTDIEIDEDDFLGKKEVTDNNHLKYYKNKCEKLGVIPTTYFEKHIGDTDFQMKYHGIGPLGAKAMAKPIEYNSSMEKVNLRGNHIQAEGTFSLSEALAENNYITNLNLAENNLQSGGCQALCESLMRNISLQVLNLSDNKLKDEDAEYIHELLLTNESLTELYLDHNEFEVEGVRWLRDALSQNTTLKVLDLSWNHIRQQGAQHVGSLIQDNYGLTKLNISMNGLADEGANCVGHALAHNNCLEQLDISDNRLSREGAISVARGLVANDHLFILKIGSNSIGQEGALILLMAFEKNDTSGLRVLDMSNVIIAAKFVDLQEEIENSGRDLQIVHGGSFYQPKIARHPGKCLQAEFEADPMSKLKRYATMAKIRLIDLFKQFDVDNSWTISREEFLSGVKFLMERVRALNKGAVVHFSEEDCDELMEKLDVDGDGEIDYGEIVEGDLKNRQEKYEMMKKVEDKEKEDQQKQQREIDMNMAMLGLGK